MGRAKEPSRGRALAFEGNGLVALDTREMLLELGYAEVTVTARRVEALSVVLTMRPDWAVLDASLPGHDLDPVIAALDAATVPSVLICSDATGQDLPAQWKGRTFLARPYVKADLEALAPRSRV